MLTVTVVTVAAAAIAHFIDDLSFIKTSRYNNAYFSCFFILYMLFPDLSIHMEPITQYRNQNPTHMEQMYLSFHVGCIYPGKAV